MLGEGDRPPGAKQGAALSAERLLPSQPSWASPPAGCMQLGHRSPSSSAWPCSAGEAAKMDSKSPSGREHVGPAVCGGPRALPGLVWRELGVTSGPWVPGVFPEEPGGPWEGASWPARITLSNTRLLNTLSERN